MIYKIFYTFKDMIPWLHMAFTTHYSTHKEDNHHISVFPKNQEHLRQSSRQFVRLLGSQGFHEKTPLSSAVVHGRDIQLMEEILQRFI